MINARLQNIRQWRYLLLLATLGALLVIEPIASTFGFMEVLFDALFVIVMAVLVFALAQEKLWRVGAYVLCIAAAMLLIYGHLLTSNAHDASLFVGHGIGAVFFVLVAGKIVGSFFGIQPLSWDAVFGAICGYLLLGVAWGLAYALMYAANPD